MAEFRERASVVGLHLVACRPKVPKSLDEVDALIHRMTEEKADEIHIIRFVFR